MPDYKKGEYIHYASAGICMVEDITSLGYLNNDEEFYILKPVGSKNSTVYVPVDNAEMTSKMRKILSRESIDQTIIHSLNGAVEWHTDRKRRNVVFKEILKSGECTEILKMIKCIYLEKLKLEAGGKKLSAADEAVLKAAEGLIDNEFSFALNIDEMGVGEYIRNIIKENM